MSSQEDLQTTLSVVQLGDCVRAILCGLEYMKPEGHLLDGPCRAVIYCWRGCVMVVCGCVLGESRY